MTFTEIFIQQVADPFRLVFLAALLMTTWRTRNDTGVLLPLALGVIFVAVIIPVTMHRDLGSVQMQIAAGLAANALIVALAVGVYLVVNRKR